LAELNQNFWLAYERRVQTGGDSAQVAKGGLAGPDRASLGKGVVSIDGSEVLAKRLRSAKPGDLNPKAR
jgi:hypothetical protein